MRILITGAGGYIGCRLIYNLWSHTVGCLPYENFTTYDNMYYNQGPIVYDALSHTNFKRESVLDWSDNLLSDLSKADVIIPLAAMVGAPLCDKNPELSTEINLEWIKKLCSYLRSDQLVIYPNTNSGYGCVPNGVCTENTPSNPISLYGKTKQQAEDYLLKNHSNSICFRLATVFGLSKRMRLDLLVNSMTYEAAKNKSIKVFDGHFRRNYVHVDDVGRAFAFAINNRSKMRNQIFNLGNDDINMTKLELANKIAEITNTKTEIVPSPGDQDQRDYLVSSQKLYNLGFKCKYDLEYGVKKVYDYCNVIDSDVGLRNY